MEQVGDESRRAESRTPRELDPNDPEAVRFVLSYESPGPSISFRSLADALATGDGMVMHLEADSGGQWLLSCEARDVRAKPAELRQLLADLEEITWGNGFDPAVSKASDSADIYFTPARPGGDATLWLHDELEQLGLRGQIAAVLACSQPRLDLPPKFPDMEFSSLAELRPYPRARVQLLSTIRGHLLVDCLASEVRVNEDRLRELIRQLDAVLENVHPLFSFVAARREPELRFVPGLNHWKRGGGHFVSTPLTLGRGYNDRPIEPLEWNREAIASIIAGREAAIRR